MAKEIISVKLKSKIKKNSFFVEKETANLITGSGLIGKHVLRIPTSITFNFPELSTSTQEKLALTIQQASKNVRLIGEASENSIDEFRFGKDVKLTKHLLNDKLTPNVSLSDEGIKDGDDEFSSVIGKYNFGQNSEFKTVNSGYKLIPFRDMNGKLQPANFLSKESELIEGFPYVYNSKTNYSQFIDSRDREYFNGTIDVFHTHLRNSELSDIRLRGVKCLLGLGNFNQSQNNTAAKKGSPLASSIFETNLVQHDFFEDAQEIILELTSSNSQVGYTSMGEFKSLPFSESDVFTSEYSHLTNVQKNTLLTSSSHEDFSIGTRFKSKQNGFIMSPFYQLSQKRSFGKDSIAFRGLLKG